MEPTRTDYKVYSVKEVLEELSGTVTLGSGNFTLLIEYLTTPELASKIEMFKEVNLRLYFLIGGYWFMAGEEINPLPQPDNILEDADKLELHEIKDRIDYCKARSFATKQIIFFFSRLRVNQYRKSIKTSKSWHFARCGGAVYNNSDIRYFPVRTIKPKTNYKKDLLEQLQMEMTDWEDALKDLREIRGE